MPRPKSADPRQVLTLRVSALELRALQARASGAASLSDYLRRAALGELSGGPAAPSGPPAHPSGAPRRCACGADGGACGYKGPNCAPLFTPQGRESTTYEVWEAAALITSHDPTTWEPDSRYPRAVQERDYKGDTNERAKVERIAAAPEPALALALTPTAVDGPPVVTGAGVVLGGNGRTMGLRLAFARGTADAYRAELRERAPAFGLTAAQVDALRAPVLVRVVRGLDDAGQAELADASSRYNEGLGNSMDERAKAVAVSRRLGPDTLAAVAAALEAHDTLRAAMGDAPTARTLVRRLEGDGLVTPQNRAALVDAEGGLTEAGKQLLEGAFLGLAVGTPERYAQAAPATLQKLERLVPALARVHAAGNGHDRIPAVQAALDVLHQAGAARLTVAEYAAQVPMFGPGPDAGAVELAGDLEGHTPKALAAAARAWAARADFDPRQPVLFGDHPSPADAWKAWREALDAAPAPARRTRAA